MIKFYPQNEIDKKKWDDCINQSFNGIIYAYSWYLDIVASEWSALIEDDYERVFPINTKSKYGINYIFQPLFAQQLGVFSKGILTNKINIRFLEAIPKKFKIIKINLNTYSKLNDSKINYEGYITHELDLINEYEQIKMQYSTNLKRNLKKAKNHQLKIIKNIKPDEITQLYLNDKDKNHQSLSEKQIRILLRLMYVAIYKGLAKAYGVVDPKNQLIAGGFFMLSKQKNIFIFSGNSIYGRKFGALPFLIDQFIQNNSHKNITLDFEGSNNPNLARFYKSFGAKVVTYPHLSINKYPVIIKKITSFFEH